MLLSVVFVLAVALEVFLFVGKDYLLKTRRRSALEASLRQTYADLTEAKKRVDGKRAALLAVVDEVERQRAQLAEVDKAFANSQKQTPTLTYALGETGAGTRFRAEISKELSADAEAAQKLAWSCKNFVDVWASDVETAQRLAASQFPGKHGYAISEFVAMPPQALSSAEEQAA